MMRALWSAASGMIAQQTNVDTISNNIANVNTTGYKTEKTEFKSLLYQNLQARTTTANGENKPIPAQVGLGTRVASNTSMFTQGAMLASESDTAFAIDGEGFFAVRGADGNTYYTRNGNFTWSIGNDGVILTNSDGYPVLDSRGNMIRIPDGVAAEKVSVTSQGQFYYRNVRQGYLEGSNVQVADEMVNLIIAQRAYELNSKAIQASDDMLSQANQLRR